MYDMAIEVDVKELELNKRIPVRVGQLWFDDDGRVGLHSFRERRHLRHDYKFRILGRATARDLETAIGIEPMNEGFADLIPLFEVLTEDAEEGEDKWQETSRQIKLG